MGLQRNVITSDGLKPFVVALTFSTLSTVAVALRLISRRMSSRSNFPAADDYMICVALFFTYAAMVANTIGVFYGGIGVHIEHVTPGQLEVFLKDFLADVLLWATSLAAVKISLLLFYIRIFAIQRFRFAAYIVMGIVVSWWLSVVFEEFFLCTPFAFNWDRTISNGKCGDELSTYIAAGVINLLSDLTVLCLPIPVIWNLRLPTRAKISLSFVFGLGFLVCIITAIRINAVVHYQILDPTYSLWETAVWSQLEPNIGIICACLPLMKPILDRWILRRNGTTVGVRTGGSASVGARRNLAAERSHDTYPLTNTFVSAKKSSGYEELSEDRIGVDTKQSGREVVVDSAWTVTYDHDAPV